MRRAHFMKPNHKLERAHSACWVDTETYQKAAGEATVSHHLQFGWALFQRTRLQDEWTEPEWHRFESRAQFWDWLYSRLRERTRTWVFAHNLAFDAPVLGVFSELPAAGWRLTGAVIESPPVILKWRRGTQSLVFLDTLNWWRVPLAKLGHSLGLEKLPYPAPTATPEEWDIYARQDVRIIHSAIHTWWDFLRRYNLGGFAPTLAGQALRAFRHRFMDHTILLDDSSDALQLGRESLHGGRVEAFRLGTVEGPVHHFDVNSMYPAVMRQHEYPTVLRLTARDVEIPELKRWTESYSVVARVRIRTSRNRFAHVIDGRLCFPIGEFTTTLTTPDVDDALSHGEVLAVPLAAVYDRAPIFRRFVEEIYALRLEASNLGDPVQSYLLKILLNSLYGKFAQRGEVWESIASGDAETVRQWREIDASTRIVRTLRQFSGVVQERSREGESTHSHPAIAAHVTAFARQRLWQLIQAAGPRRVYYVDTDSLFTSAAGARALAQEVDPQTLGAIKHEATYPWLLIHGPKDYETPEKKVVKGVRSKAEWIKAGAVVQEEWSRLAGLIRSGSLDAPTTTRRVKELRRVYTKGRVLSDGRVLPFLLQE